MSFVNVMPTEELHVKRCYLNNAGEAVCEVRKGEQEEVLPLDQILNDINTTAVFADMNGLALQESFTTYQDKHRQAVDFLSQFRARQKELNSLEKKKKNL